MSGADQRAVFGLIYIGLSFLVMAAGSILGPTVRVAKYDHHFPAPKPPSCCGDSICLMEHHHDFKQ